MFEELLSKYEFKSQDLNELLPKEIGIRKKMGIYFDEENIIFVISQKSRVLIKDTVKFEEILEKVNSHLSKKFIKKIIIIDSPLCSKAKKELENLKWEVKV